MDVRMMEWMIWQNEMKNLQIKWSGVDGIINMKSITEYLHQGMVFRDQFTLPSALRITQNGTVYMYKIWLE